MTGKFKLEIKLTLTRWISHVCVVVPSTPDMATYVQLFFFKY